MNINNPRLFKVGDIIKPAYPYLKWRIKYKEFNPQISNDSIKSRYKSLMNYNFEINEIHNNLISVRHIFGYYASSMSNLDKKLIKKI